MDSPRSSAPPHVLVADDDPDILALVQLNLARAGYRVSTATDGIGALEAGLAGGYDVMVLDWLMPGLSGVEVCRDLRAAGIDVPVVLLTAKDAEEDIARAFEAGVTDYVTKPFDARTIADHLAVLLVAEG